MRKKISCFVCMLFWMGVLATAGCGDRDRALLLPVQQEANTPDAESPEAEEIAEAAAASGGAREAGEMGDSQEHIYVYVCGAVQDPRVVELPEGSRAADALRAAGGFAPDARTDAVNLAERVQDQQMLRIPSLEEDILSAADAGSSDGRVNINTAGVEELMTLSGIGEARARDIISYRESHGGFSTIEDIKKVSGIKDSIFQKIADDITVK